MPFEGRLLLPKVTWFYEIDWFCPCCMYLSHFGEGKNPAKPTACMKLMAATAFRPSGVRPILSVFPPCVQLDLKTVKCRVEM